MKKNKLTKEQFVGLKLILSKTKKRTYKSRRSIKSSKSRRSIKSSKSTIRKRIKTKKLSGDKRKKHTRRSRKLSNRKRKNLYKKKIKNLKKNQLGGMSGDEDDNDNGPDLLTFELKDLDYIRITISIEEKISSDHGGITIESLKIPEGNEKIEGFPYLSDQNIFLGIDKTDVESMVFKYGFVNNPQDYHNHDTDKSLINTKVIFIWIKLNEEVKDYYRELKKNINKWRTKNPDIYQGFPDNISNNNLRIFINKLNGDEINDLNDKFNFQVGPTNFSDFTIDFINEDQFTKDTKDTKDKSKTNNKWDVYKEVRLAKKDEEENIEKGVIKLEQTHSSVYNPKEETYSSVYNPDYYENMFRDEFTKQFEQFEKFNNQKEDQETIMT